MPVGQQTSLAVGQTFRCRQMLRRKLPIQRVEARMARVVIGQGGRPFGIAAPPFERLFLAPGSENRLLVETLQRALVALVHAPAGEQRNRRMLHRLQ